jgi:hypothetical protein
MTVPQPVQTFMPPSSTICGAGHPGFGQLDVFGCACGTTGQSKTSQLYSYQSSNGYWTSSTTPPDNAPECDFRNDVVLADDCTTARTDLHASIIDNMRSRASWVCLKPPNSTPINRPTAIGRPQPPRPTTHPKTSNCPAQQLHRTRIRRM